MQGAVRATRSWSVDEGAEVDESAAGFTRTSPLESEQFREYQDATRSFPHFAVSEGERRFSVENASRYTLLVVYGIDFTGRARSIYFQPGAIPIDMANLRVVQWKEGFAP